jgi:hypothetical protein
MRTNPVSRATGTMRAVIAAAVMSCAAPAHAVELFGDSAKWSGSWDTTLSYGSVWRVQSAQDNIVCTSNGGDARSCNYDDGTLNYGTGQVSNLFRALTEVQIEYDQRFGVFARADGFYDTKADDTDRTELTSSAKDMVEKDVNMLDLFGYARFSIGDMPAELRVGKQVVNWGESTFFLTGMASLNHFDVTKLRGAAVNLKAGLLPQELVYFNISPTTNLTLEAFYQWDWDDTEPDPVGSWFSTNDFAVKGGEFVMLGFGGYGDLGTDWTPLGGFFDPNFQHVPRAQGEEPDNGGQYGFAARYFFEKLLGGTEIGLYYANYHSRLPVLSGRTGTQAGFGNAVGVATAASATAFSLASGQSFDAAVSTGTAAGAQRAASLGGDISTSELSSWATVGANTFLGGGDVESLGSALATDQFGKTASFRTEFPEDIQIYGLSFATNIFGLSWQGEYTYKKDTPLQQDDVELLFAALSPLDAIGMEGCATNPKAVGPLGCYNQNGPKQIDQRVQGWREKDVSQFQTTFTWFGDPMLGADLPLIVAEAAFTQVHGFEDKSSGGPNGWGLRYDAPGTFISGNAPLASAHYGEVEPNSNFADDFSWGYRILASLQYNNLIGPWTVTPRLAFSQDVEGNSPGPGGNFVEDRLSYTVGVRGDLQNKWQIDLAYTQFSSAGKQNLIRDRDFIGATLSVSF